MANPVRPIRIEGDVAYLTLTHGHEAIIDADDVPMVAGVNWRALVSDCTVYAVRGHRTGTKVATIYMHRTIMAAPEGLEVDHINCNGLDNRRKENLRIATRSENTHNTRIRSDNSSGFKGVNWHNQNGKWRARIQFGSKRKHLGCFATLEEAHDAYIKASAQYHGAFGRTE